MKIILLTGNHKTGKSTTFDVLYNMLTKCMKNPPVKQPIRTGSPEDFQCVIKYKCKKIALYSHGDTLYLIHEAIIRYSEVDYLVLAFSLGGADYQQVLNFIVNNCPQHTVINKTVSTNAANQVADNKIDCAAIKTAIRKQCKFIRLFS